MSNETSYINKPLLKKDTIEKREYQEYLSNVAINQSTLIVLPTGTGKTIVNLLITAQRLHEQNGTALLMAPTKPLVEQHIETYKSLLNIPNDEIVLFTGDTKPDKRKEIWDESPSIIVSTPQVIENDIISDRISLSNVTHLTIDECHRATGDYAYVYIAQKYIEQSKNPLITGLSASPGDSREDILEICNNINVNSIEVISEDDERLEPYLYETNIDNRFIDISDEVIKIRDILQEVYKSRLVKLYENDYVDSRSKTLSNYKLRQARGKIQKAMQENDSSAYKAMSIWAEAMKLNSAINLLETQGVESFDRYVSRLESEARSEDSSKAVQRLLSDRKMEKAIKLARSHTEDFAKFKVLRTELVSKVKIEGEKALVFTKSRDTVEALVDYLDDTFDVGRLVGQTDKENSEGMSQKQQKEAIEKFGNGETDVLISTQIGEEGLDISQVDLVVFYEPAQRGIEQIQRKGRTGRNSDGKVLILIGKDTKDMGLYYKSKNALEDIDSGLESLKEIDNIQDEIKEELQEQNEQTTFESFTDDTENKFTEKSEGDVVKIIADSRETNSSVVKNLDMDEEVDVEIVNNLEVGDYILGNNCAVERKDVVDFADTLTGERSLFGQLGSMSTEYDKSILLIEGEHGKLYTQNIHPNAIRAAKSSLIVDYGISIIESMNEEDTASLLKYLAKKEQVNKDTTVNPHGKKKTKTIKEEQEYIVSSIKNIGPKNAKHLLNEFNNINEIFNADVSKLKEVETIGEEKAKHINSITRTEYTNE